MNDRSTYAAMLWFLGGGLVGAGVGLLLAPQSGRATRDAMQHRLHQGAEAARNLKNRAVRRSDDVRHETVRRVNAAASALAGRDAEDVASV